MKTILKYITPALLLLSLFSCENNEIEITEGEALAITLNSQNIVLEQSKDGELALTIKWTSGTNHKTGAAISYFFEWDIAGNNFKGGIKDSIGKTSARVMTFTHKELNDTILKTWSSVNPGKIVNFEMRMTATVSDPSVPVQVSPIQTLTVKTYKWSPQSIYMVGSATPGGWDNQKATALKNINGEEGGFYYDGDLYSGEMKFLTSIGKWLPCYVRYESRQDSMVYRETDETYPDFKWVIDKEGTYNIKLNVLTNKISITPVSVHKNIWMIGSATPNGWSLDNATKLNYNSESGLYTYNGTLTEGEVKFPLQKTSFDKEMLFAPAANTPVPYSGAYVQGSAETSTPDYKWIVTAETAGYYTITINTSNSTVQFVKQ